MVVFYIVRHGQTLLNHLNRAQGWIDSPLTDSGKQAAMEVGEKLKGISFRAACASDTQRAVQTAELILSTSGNANVSIQSDPRLREWCLGSLEAESNPVFIQTVMDWLGGTLSFAELNVRLPEVSAVIHQHDTTGMSEPFSVIVQRLQQVFAAMAGKYRSEEVCPILVVTHAFVIKTLVYLFAPDQLCKIGKVKNTMISRLQFDGAGFSLEPELSL